MKPARPTTAGAVALAAFLILAASAHAATLKLSPTAGPAGTKVSASGTGFGKRASGNVSLGATRVATFSANAKGAFSVSFAVPSGYAGTTPVTAQALTTSASASFDVTGPAPADTSPPAAPTGITASPGSGTVTISWTPNSEPDVAGYRVYRDGAQVASPTAATYTDGNLSNGTSYGYQVSAVDSSGNESARSATVTATPQAASSPQYGLRGVYERDSSATGFDYEAQIGFDMIDSGPYADQLDALAARGLKAFVWLGGYSNTTCSFNQSDDWVRSHVKAIAGHPAVAAYFVDDEPNAATCPTAPAQMKARSDLVKSIDPGPPTLLVDYKVDQFKLWAGTVDILGLDHYPCSYKYGCDYSKIDDEAAEADRLGVRYWGVVQAYGDDWYRVPTADELHQEFVHWRATHMEGYLVFSWEWPSWDPASWLAYNDALQQQLAIENGS